MDLSPGYGLPEAWTERLEVLSYIYDRASGRSNVLVVLSVAHMAETASGYSDRELANLLHDFAERGWVAFAPDVSLAGLPEVRLLPRGVDFIERVHRRRDDPVIRRKAARDALLRWLYDCAARSQDDTSLSQIQMTDFGVFLGVPFSRAEIEAASNWLAENGLIRGTKAWGHGVVRPSITAKGESLVERGASVNDPNGDRQRGHKVIVKGNNNTVTTSSPHARINVAITVEARERVIKVADALDWGAGSLGLDPGDEREARDLGRDLRDETTKPQPDQGRLRQLLQAVQRIVVSGSGAALGEGIASLAAAALEALQVG